MAESTMGSWWKRLFGGGGGSSSESQFTTTGDQSTPSLGASFRNLGANLFGTQPTATEKLGMRTVMPGDTTNYSGVKFGQGAILPPGFQAPEGLSNPFGPINLNSPAAVEQPYSAAYTIPFNQIIQRQAEAVVGLYGPKFVGATGAGAGAKRTGGGTAGGTTSPKFTQSEIVQGLIANRHPEG